MIKIPNIWIANALIIKSSQLCFDLLSADSRKPFYEAISSRPLQASLLSHQCITFKPGSHLCDKHKHKHKHKNNRVGTGMK